MIFMGIDPGLNKTGVGIVYADIGKVEAIEKRLDEDMEKNKK